MSSTNIYAMPKNVDSLDECCFYHTMDIPGYGLVRGEWDLRPNIRRYLGGIDLSGRRVLEVGTASGYVCLWMERQEADVVAFDLSDQQRPDIVPYARSNFVQRQIEIRQFVGGIKNGYWLAHKAYGSKAKVVYGTAYDIPQEIGQVDISVFGAILSHLRDPFLALQSALRLTRETVVVTEPIWYSLWLHFLYCLPLHKKHGGWALFLPYAEAGKPAATWWSLSPGIVKKFIAILGFEESRVKYHFQIQEGVGRSLFYTVVGRRTVDSDWLPAHHKESP